MDIQAILSDWHGGLTNGEILSKYRLTKAQEYALINCSASLTIDQIKERLQSVNSDMSAKEIETLMSAA
jgi:uncharacterized protein (DUF433 family)